MNRKDFIKNFYTLGVVSLLSIVSYAKTEDLTVKQCYEQAKHTILTQLGKHHRYVDKYGREYLAVYPVHFFYYKGKSGTNYKFCCDLPVKARRI